MRTFTIGLYNSLCITESTWFLQRPAGSLRPAYPNMPQLVIVPRSQRATFRVQDMAVFLVLLVGATLGVGGVAGEGGLQSPCQTFVYITYIQVYIYIYIYIYIYMNKYIHRLYKYHHSLLRHDK